MTQGWTQLSHHGYGALYNTLYVSPCRTILRKRTNASGKSKLDCEAGFYAYVETHQVPFPIPKVLHKGDDTLDMAFLSDHVPLHTVWRALNDSQQRALLDRIMMHLDSLHASSKRAVSKSDLARLLHLETHEKIASRHRAVADLVSAYAHVTHVNGVRLCSFEELMGKIKAQVGHYVDGLADGTPVLLSPIHGDCQFHNIMVHPETHEPVFIDPRGYFGDLRVYGLEDYDVAKVLFALTGYDRLDDQRDSALDVRGNTLTIDADVCLESIVRHPSHAFARMLMVSIWLGNAHSFARDDPLKAVYSHFLALYIGTVFLD